MHARLTRRRRRNVFAALVTVLIVGCDDPTERVVALLSEPASEPSAAAPAREAVPGPMVVLTATSGKPLQGFTLRVEYPIATGGFVGSADGVACSSAAPGFTPNDKDDGTMLLVTGTIGTLKLPVVVRCRYETKPGASLAPGDIRVVAQSVTAGGVAGDPADVKVAVTLD